MKSSSYWLSILSVFMVSILISCEKPDITEDPDLLNALYSNSFDTVIIDDSNYFLETEITRNLMPGGPIPTKRKLVALIYLVKADSLPILSSIDITRLYIIKGNLIWTSKPSDSNLTQVPDYKLDKLSNEGPEWETDIYVDAVAEIIDNLNNKKSLVIARDQYITALY